MIDREKFLMIHSKRILVTDVGVKMKRYLRCVELLNAWTKREGQAGKMIRKYKRKVAYYHNQGIGGGNIKK